MRFVVAAASVVAVARVALFSGVLHAQQTDGSSVPPQDSTATQSDSNGDALDGCYFSDHYAKEDNRPEVQEFLKKYQAEYGKTPDSMAALGYDAANLLFDAMARAPSMNGKDLAKAVADTKDFKAVTGTITLDEHRNASKPAVVIEIRGGKKLFNSSFNP